MLGIFGLNDVGPVMVALSVQITAEQVLAHPTPLSHYLHGNRQRTGASYPRTGSGQCFIVCACEWCSPGTASMADADDVRRLALALPGVVELDSDGFDFRAAGKGFVWSYPELSLIHISEPTRLGMIS